MTAAEFHQQQLEHEQYLEELAKTKRIMEGNHGKFVGVATWIRDYAQNKADIDLALERLAEVLEEYNQIERRIK